MFSGKNVKIPMINYDLKWIVPPPPPLWRLSYISSVTTTTINCSQIIANLAKSCIINCFKVSDSNNSDVRGFL